MTDPAEQLRALAADVLGVAGVADDAVSQITEGMTRLAGAARAMADLADTLDGQPQTPTVTVTAEPGVGQVAVAWSITPEAVAEQVTGWLVGRDGTDTTGAPAWSTTDSPEKRSRDFLKLRAGTEYTFSVRALLAGGATAEGTVKATPTTPTSGPTPVGAVPLAGRSGLGHNSGVFVGGTDVAATEPFVAYRQTEIDAYLTFVTRDKGWATMGAIHPSWATFVQAGGIVIISIPPQPQGQRNDATARGENNGWWRDYGTRLAAAGMTTRTVLRVGWECNGYWYDWSWGDDKDHAAKNTPESYVQAVRHVSDSAKTANPGLLVSCNLNRGSRRTGHDWRDVLDALTEVSPVTGRRYADVIGVDSYDMYPGATSDARWLEQIGQDPGPESVAAYCRARGVQLAYEEWGPIKAGGASGTGGGDNPRYAHGMWDLIQRQRDILAYEIAYPHIGTNDYDHRWLGGEKPQFSAAYLSHWGGTT